MRRVTRGPVVIMTFDPVPPKHWWLMDYVPELLEVDARRMPEIIDLLADLGGGADVIPVLVPVDRHDGFGQASFARPERLLEPEVRRATSAESSVPDDVVGRFVNDISQGLSQWRARCPLR